MPLQSGHVFASHIGHTGKTTLCFQMSCAYAKSHPDVSVLVMDLAEEGDLTKRLLGGVDSYDEKGLEFGAVFRLLGEADRKSSGLTSWLFSSSVDVAEHAMNVAEHNANVPQNLFLVSSGCWPQGDQAPFDADKRKGLAKKILDGLEKSDKTWKLFCDTDGDRRPSPFTMLAYSLCPQAVVPLHLSKADLDRTETMFGIMKELRDSGDISTQVLLIVWNMVKPQSNSPMDHHGLLLPFTPSKVSLDILDACNRRIAALARDPEFAGLFARGSAETTEAAFLQSSVAVMRQLADNVLKPAEELGMPFVQMVQQLEASGKKQLTFQSQDVKYQAGEDVVRGVDEALRGLTDKFEAMALDGK